LKRPNLKNPAIARRGKKLPTVLTEEERIALLQQPNERTATGLRNACLLTVMLDAGLRAAEAIYKYMIWIVKKRCQEPF
jgi:site-specific recombinase XerD